MSADRDLDWRCRGGRGGGEAAAVREARGGRAEVVDDEVDAALGGMIGGYEGRAHGGIRKHLLVGVRLRD